MTAYGLRLLTGIAILAVCLPQALRAQDYLWLRANGPDGGDCRSIAFAPGGQRVVAGFVRGLHVSDDGGITWSCPPSGGFAALGLAFDPTNSQVVYAAVSSSSDPLRKSTDAGSTWTRIRILPVDPQPALSCVAVSPGDGNSIYAGATSNGVYRTTDGGAGWTQANAGMGNVAVRALTIDPTNTSRIICGTLSGVFVTSDGGDTWTSANSGLGSTDVRDLAMHSSNPLIVYAATANGVYRTDDGCASWHPRGLSGIPTHSLAIAAQAPNVLLAGTPNGVFRTTDGGLNWNPSSSGLEGRDYVRVVAIAPAVSGLAMAGTGGSIFRSVDGGANWAVSASGVRGMRCQALAASGAVPGAVALGCGTGIYGAGVWISRNWGLDWEFVGGGNDYVYSLAMGAGGPETLFAGCDLGILRTLDGGRSWDRTIVEGANRFVALCADSANPGRFYAGSNGNAVWRTLDSGANWSKSSSGLDWPAVRCLGIDPGQTAKLYAGVDATFPRYGVYGTPDGAASWQPAQSGIQAERIWSIAVDPVDGAVYAGSMSNGLFKSVDGGVAFYPTGAGLGSPVVSLAVDPVSRRVYAGTWGGVYLSSDLGQTFDKLGGFDELPLALLVDPRNHDFVYVGSDGDRVWRLSIRADLRTPSEAKSRPDGQLLRLSAVTVSAVLGGRIYVQSDERCSGIAVVSNATVSEGDRIEVTGTIRTIAGEREIEALSVTVL